MTSATMSRSLALPSSRTVINLALGGFAGLGFWELFAAVPTAWFAEYPLEPPELVKSLFSHQLGITLSTPVAKLLHFVTGFLFYPLGYWVLTRWVKSFGMPADGWIWGVITYFIALGFFAPLAGQHFLLSDVPRLSLMSLVGHAIYGYLAAYVFEVLEARMAHG
jgi:small-conductance mechanosensitive channel